MLLDCSCGETYTKFRTGLAFVDVKMMMWSGSEDPADWRHRRRHSVLGYWHELKIQLWMLHLGLCEQVASGEPPF